MRDGFGRGFGVGLLLVAGAALGQTTGNPTQTAAGNPGQAAAGKLAFVSGTVTLSAQPTRTKMLGTGVMGINPGPKNSTYATAICYTMSLKQLIASAYGVTTDHVSGPAWLNDPPYYIIMAKMPAGTSVNDAQEMLQTLLEDRFKLAVHTELKNQQVLALVVAKGGPKLQPATPGQPDGMTM